LREHSCKSHSAGEQPAVTAPQPAQCSVAGATRIQLIHVSIFDNLVFCPLKSRLESSYLVSLLIPFALYCRAMILLIEDEPGIVDFVKRGLTAEGFAVEAALVGTEGERRALSE